MVIENKAWRGQKTHLGVDNTATEAGKATDRAVEASAIALRNVRLVHTVIWALFAGCIFVIPFFAWVGRYRHALVLIAVVFVEVLVLVFNGWRCPLTNIAALYTDDRRDNFDIYLPGWLARNNKAIFGFLYVVGILLTVALMAGMLPR